MGWRISLLVGGGDVEIPASFLAGAAEMRSRQRCVVRDAEVLGLEGF